MTLNELNAHVQTTISASYLATLRYWNTWPAFRYDKPFDY